jgi:hypothetical protein
MRAFEYQKNSAVLDSNLSKVIKKIKECKTSNRLLAIIYEDLLTYNLYCSDC